MKNLVILFFLLTNTSCAYLIKSSVISPQGVRSHQQFISNGKCLGAIGSDNTRKIVILPQPNGYLRFVGPLFLPIFPAALSWSDKVDLLRFDVIMQDYKNKESAEKAVDEARKAENWVLLLGSRKVVASSVQPHLYSDGQHYLKVIFRFPRQIIDEYEFKYLPEGINLKYKHRLKWVYRAFALDPKLASQCDIS